MRSQQYHLHWTETFVEEGEDKDNGEDEEPQFEPVDPAEEILQHLELDHLKQFHDNSDSTGDDDHYGCQYEKYFT